MSQWAAEVKARGVAEVAAALGLTVRPNGRNLGPCPACKKLRRGSSDLRGPVGLTRDGLGWICHRCQVKGDAVTLAALVCLERVPDPSDAAGWRVVAACCEDRGLCAGNQLPDDAAKGGKKLPPTHAEQRAPGEPPGKKLPSEPAPHRPPADEVAEVWARCRPVTDDAEVCAWLLEGKKRRIDPALVAERDLARALPRAGRLPAWAVLNGVSWSASSYRMIAPLYGAGGRLESLHARAVAPTAKPKAASPKGAEVRGLVMADAAGRLLLQGTPPAGTDRVIVSEGVPDYLTWATHYGEAAEDAPAVVGIVEGSWTPAIAATIPTGWTLRIRTDPDPAGDKYAETIRASVAGRCRVTRPRSHVST